MPWQQQLLKWYHQHRRDLPWRRNPTPYRVWISEIMLQQTTVKTVIPYYRRFLKQFPSLKALADSSEETIVAAWSGLGYYSRARNLLKTAQLVRQQHGGRLPKNVDELIQLPGIGRYTAGAISSIAFDQPAPIVDGNVIRVLSRLFAIGTNPKSTAGQKIFWQKAEEILPQKKCGDFNQGLMELGATLCTPTRPLCSLCPIKKSCYTFQKDSSEKFPRLPKRKQTVRVHLTSVLIQKGQSFLMIQRPNQGSLKNMWEFPTIEGEKETWEEVYGISLNKATLLPTIRHGIMNQRITITPWYLEIQQKENKIMNSHWIEQDKINALPQSALVTKMLQLITKS